MVMLPPLTVAFPAAGEAVSPDGAMIVYPQVPFSRGKTIGESGDVVVCPVRVTPHTAPGSSPVAVNSTA